MPNLVPTGNNGFIGSYANGAVVNPSIINSYSALTIPGYKRAVQFLADNLASFPRAVHKDGSPAVTPHPLNRLINREPNGYDQTAHDLWKTLFFHAVHRANGYLQIIRGRDFAPIELNNLLPEHICPIRYDHANDRDKDGKLINVDGKGNPISNVQQYYLHTPTGTIMFGADVIHIHTGLSYDGMAGIDPIILHEPTLQRAASLDKFQTLLIQKGTIIRGTIQFPEGVTKEQVDEVKQILRLYFRGADAEEDVLVLSDGAEFKNTTISPADCELSKQEATVNKQIGQMFGINPVYLFEYGDSKYNPATIEQAGQDLVRYTFRPLIESIEAQLSKKLLSPRDRDNGYEIKLDPSALLRGSTKEQEDIVSASVNAGIRTKNEGRALLGLPAVKDANADKLQALGDTAGPPTGPEKTNAPAPALPPPPEQHSEDSKDTSKLFAGMQKIIDAACQRVDQKTEKAFSNSEKKPPQERIVWSNVFSEEQHKYVAMALGPISEALETMGLPPLPIQQIAEKYSAGIRKRASTGEVVPLRILLD